jgi:hypothetical protein
MGRCPVLSSLDRVSNGLAIDSSEGIATMSDAAVTKQTHRYLAVLTALAVIAVLVFGSGLYSQGILWGSGDGASSETRDAIVGGPGPDITSLNLDRDGADIEEGKEWGTINAAGGATSEAIDGKRGPDITSLNLDRDGADIVED